MTAVKWLNDEILGLDVEFDVNLISRENYWIKRKEIIEQAKEMEKQQIIDAYGVGYLTDFKLNSDYTTQTPEQYYNETFKSE